METMGFAGLNPSYDLIDACVRAVAARDSVSRLGSDEVDISGLQMEINC
jgi:hypothetical protein